MDPTTSPPIPLSKADRAARDYAERWFRDLLVNLWAILKNNKQAYREFESEWKELFSDPTEEQIQAAVEMIPENMRWWAAEARAATDKESATECRNCGHGLAVKLVKVCPGCHVVLHVDCYEDGRDGYSTPGCACCEQRCLHSSTST